MIPAKREWKKVLESDLQYVADELRETVDVPAVIILSGPVGIGKTTFSKHFVKNYSTREFLESHKPIGTDQVISPTYSLINDYGETVHGDFYRLENPDEIVQLELELYLDSADYFLIEWGKPFLDEIERQIPEDFTLYELEIMIHEDDISRDFTLRDL